MLKIKKDNLKKAIKKMGRKPLNPIGTCFDSSLHQILVPEIQKLKDLKMVHAIIVANMPGQEGREAAHAWIEFTNETGLRAAIDTTWGIICLADYYRSQLNLKYEVNYTLDEVVKHGKVSPAPWDDKLKKFLKERGL